MHKFYTYLIGWSTIDKWYYGCQYGKKSNPDNLWTTYFTSSKVVKNCREKYGEPDVIKVRKVFTDKNECLKWEHKVLGRLNVSNKSKWLNKNFGSGQSITTTVNVKCLVTGIYIGPVDINHPLYVSGEYIPFNKGVKKGPNKSKGISKPTSRNKVVVGDVNEIFYKVYTNDSRLITGELKPLLKNIVSIRNIETGEIIQHTRADELPEGFSHLAKGRVNIKDKDGNKFQVLKTDPRFISGELIHVHTGNKMKDPSKASRPKEKNGRWSGITDEEYLTSIRSLINAYPDFRWKQITDSINLPNSRQYLRKIIESEFDLPTYNNRKLTNSK